MLKKIVSLIKDEVSIWRSAALPGIGVIIIIIAARFSGLLQDSELMLLDKFLSMRTAEPVDKEIVIIGINEDDIQEINKYPIPDKNIAELINKIQRYNPKVIGLDIFKNIPVEPGSKDLTKIFQENKNIVGVEKALEPGKIAPPPSLPKEQVGFVDIIPDKDSKYRRYLLWIPNPENRKEGKFSFSLRLAAIYLSYKGIQIEEGRGGAIKFDKTELPLFSRNTGGYVETDDGGTQILMNFRNGEERFNFFSLKDIIYRKNNLSFLKNKIVLIGMTSSSIPDFFSTSAISDLKLNGQIYGVEYHAHAISQIINAVLNGRPLLKTWSDKMEYLWIIVWGFIPIIIGRLTQSIWHNLLAVSFNSIFLIGISYLLLMHYGLWIPTAPVLLILAINGVGLSAFTFYRHDQALKSQIKARQSTIEYTFNVIHNGPLQTLAHTLSNAKTKEIPQKELIYQLERLNHEIRDIGDFLKKQALSSEEILRLGSGLTLDLNKPINELFYEVYASTIERDDFKYLSAIKIKTRSFEPIKDKNLNIEQKRELCQFLEEALCNIGKHAEGAKRIQVTGKYCNGWYVLSIKDNGCGISSSAESKGTKQCQLLANKLNGNFKRESILPRGTLCELTWPSIKD
ncbi:MAG: CHASE2 domain-containing protein [Scytonematopsis contorta HA4267-MV1]|jgi:CHASE2 domain-containing sensor protein|nr:CHASE2 domain-containing protein [Scytonematopsis contorta HA4267-MV1]